DSVLDILANDGTTPIESDDDGPSTSSAVAGAVVPQGQAGNVFFKVTAKSATATINPYSLFQIVVSPTDVAAEVEPNNTLATPSLVNARLTTGSVSGADVDFYKFPITSVPATVAVIVDEDPDKNAVLTDTRIEIIDTNGTATLATGDNDPTHN